MCRDNGLRCKCSDKPIELCLQLERELRDARQQMIVLRREIEHQKARAAAMPNEKS
jgi:hypothetical protein